MALDTFSVERKRQLLGGDKLPKALMPLLEPEPSVELMETVQEKIAQLTTREGQVATMRLGLDGQGMRSLEETAQEMGETRETVTVLQVKAWKKLQELV